MQVCATNRPVEVNFPPNGVFVLESRHGGAFRMEETAHDYWKVLHPFRGAGRLVVRGRGMSLGAGDVALVPPGVKHRIEDEAGKPLALYGVCVRREVLGAAGEQSGRTGNARVFRGAAWGGEATRILRALLLEQSRPDGAAAAMAVGLAWQLMALAWRAAEGGAGPVAGGKPEARGGPARVRVAAYVRQLARTFPAETTIDAAAARLGLGRRRFTDLFRATSGMSWVEALRALRVEHATRLLRETDRSVAAVAFESGFSDLSHFHRVFRDASGGITPERWRQKRRTVVRPRGGVATR